MTQVAHFDIETGDADQLYSASPGYVRLCGVAVDGIDSVGITDDPAKMIRVLEKADVIVAHHGSGFDLPALARHCGADYDALSAKLVDTLRLAQLQDPPGSKHSKPWGERGYYGLDQLAQRHGVAGKITGDAGLHALAREFGGFDRIPTTDQRYRAYLRQDVVALRDTFQAMGGLDALNDYARREMRVAHLQNRMTLNGWRIDVPLLDQRVREEEDRKRESEQWLATECGLPLTKTITRGRGANKTSFEEPVASPLSTDAGRAAMEQAFQAAGIQFVPRTESGKLALSKDAMGDGFWFRGKGAKAKKLPGMLRAYPDNPQVRAICEHIAVVSGAVAKYAEIQKFVLGDRVHARIGTEDATDQASGRWAMTQPSFTNVGKRGGKVVQRGPMIAEEGHVLVAVDADQVDMRGIAAHCQDPAYMALFRPGADAHSMITDRVFGRRNCDCTGDRHTCVWRERSKRCGHGWNYGMSVGGLINSGVDPDVAQQFDTQMQEQFPILCSWRQEVREEAAAGKLLDNGFGRFMRADPERAYTQAPALMGQGSARDLMTTGMLRFVEAVPESLGWLRGVVHDELVLSVPEKDAEEITRELVKAMTWEWRGVPITAGASKFGRSWDQCYAKD